MGSTLNLPAFEAPTISRLRCPADIAQPCPVDCRDDVRRPSRSIPARLRSGRSYSTPPPPGCLNSARVGCTSRRTGAMRAARRLGGSWLGHSRYPRPSRLFRADGDGTGDRLARLHVDAAALLLSPLLARDFAKGAPGYPGRGARGRFPAQARCRSRHRARVVRHPERRLHPGRADVRPRLQPRGRWRAIATRWWCSRRRRATT
jgi:hypothetical protein